MPLYDMVIEAFRLDLAAKLLIAVLIGGGVGLERELKGKPAGLRTNILICVGSALLMDLSMSLSATYGGDPGRIAAQVVTGIGFLGAGTILHTRGQITGLTSAATIWVVAALGLTIGAGYFVEAAGSSLTVILVLVGLGWVERRYLPHGQEAHEALELVVAGNEIRFRVDFDDSADVALGDDADQTVGGDPARLLGSFRQALLAQPIDGGFDIARGFRQRGFAVHHASAGLIAQLFHEARGNSRHEYTHCVRGAASRQRPPAFIKFSAPC